MLKDIEITGNHGFTGLLGLNPYNPINKGKKPELQFSCRVRAFQK